MSESETEAAGLDAHGRLGLHGWRYHEPQNHLWEHELPQEYHLRGIKRGYRLGGTYADCLWGRLGLFVWHNQTLNSWTMIIGWALSTYFLVSTLSALQHWEPLEVAAYVGIWLCPTVHLPFTVGYHQFLCMSPTILRRWRAWDVTFIFIASVPLTYGLCYFVFPLPLTLAATCLTGGLATHAWHYSHHLPAGKEIDKRRNARYVALVVNVYMAPVYYQAAVDVWTGAGAAHGYYSVQCAASALFCFAWSWVVYTKDWPDHYAPGMFDYIGAAQQLMHLGIALGSATVEWMFAWHRCQVLHKGR